MSDDPEVKINEQQEEVVEYQEQTDSNNIDLTIKHPLQNSWTMWYDHGCKKGVAWGDHLHEIFTFSSVEDFWSLYNNLRQPGTLSDKSTYHLFKEGIKPLWEHDVNREGGQWIITPEPGKMDDLWLSVLLACIGEIFGQNTEHEDLGELICGAVISIRKQGDKVGLWVKSGTKDQIMAIGTELKRVLNWRGTKIGYISHQLAMNTAPSKFRNRQRLYQYQV